MIGLPLFSILFGLGAGLFFTGLFYPGRAGRFHRELKKQRRGAFRSFFTPFLYLGPLQYLLRSRKSFSRLETNLLLERAGYPLGLKAEQIILAKLLLPLGAVVILPASYVLQRTGGSIQRTLTGALATPSMPSLEKLLPLLAISIFILFNTPGFILNLCGRQRERRVMAEQGLFSEIIFMSLYARLNLREAMEEAAKTTDYLQPYLRICLNEWPNDRIRALHNLKRNVGVLSFSMVVDLLLQAAAVGDERIAQFLQENKKLEDEIRNLEITAKNKTRPLMITVQMILPLLVILIILFYPLSVQVEGLIRTLF
ncbi:MAG: hypothetical protein RBT41_10335 [Clostridia bacterium]|nr:hypothetical protein [Clostridia bacterium]